MTPESVAGPAPTRRVLLAAFAAVAGGADLAFAPEPAVGEARKEGKPPLVVAVARLLDVETVVSAEGIAYLRFTHEVVGFDLRPDPVDDFAYSLVRLITPGAAGRMREAISREVRGSLSDAFSGVPADRLAFLIP